MHWIFSGEILTYPGGKCLALRSHPAFELLNIKNILIANVAAGIMSLTENKWV